MAAGLGFKDFTTGEVLTAADVDGYLMQGIWVFASAAARDAAVTSPQEGNACYLKDTDVIQVYTGSAWAAQSASNPISANIVDAKGDLIAGTAADTVGRLAVGANNTVLTADSSTATGLKWASPAGGGKVLQVVSATTATSTSIITTTYTDTTITATITPTSASSQILVLASSIAYLYRETANEFGAGARLMRGATALFTNQNFQIIGGVSVSQKSLAVQSAWNYLDSPATTSATTYKIQAKTDGTAEIRFQAGSDTSVITLLEIGA